MSLTQTGSNWQFTTEAALEEVIWHNLSDLLNLKPLHRQFQVDGKYCDILALDEANELVIIELKNTEDRYVVQQLVRYYDAIYAAKALPFEIESRASRLVAIAPSFHADTLTDCRYCTLDIELITFKVERSPQERFSLALSSAIGEELSRLRLPRTVQSSPTATPVPEPPRKLLNWLSHNHPLEHTWLLALRQRLLSSDPRMREVVEANRIIYGKGKSKPCCQMKKATGRYRKKGVDCSLWLPHLENKPHVIQLLVGFDLEKHQVAWVQRCHKGNRYGKLWRFPECIEWMEQFRYERALEQYQPYLGDDLMLSPTGIVGLALRTWENRL